MYIAASSAERLSSGMVQGRTDPVETQGQQKQDGDNRIQKPENQNPVSFLFSLKRPLGLKHTSNTDLPAAVMTPKKEAPDSFYPFGFALHQNDAYAYHSRAIYSANLTGCCSNK